MTHRVGVASAGELYQVRIGFPLAGIGGPLKVAPRAAAHVVPHAVFSTGR